MIHGLFENAVIRDGLLETLRAKKGFARRTDGKPIPARDDEYDRLAQVVREHLDMALLARIARKGL
jgi:cobyric acid synthase